MGENDPAKIIIDEIEETKENEVITVFVKGKRFLVTPSEGLSIINQLSGVLMAYGYSGRRTQGTKKYT